MDPDDPNVIAENELLSAANSIEAAAKKLSQLRPRQKARVCSQHQSKTSHVYIAEHSSRYECCFTKNLT